MVINLLIPSGISTTQTQTKPTKHMLTETTTTAGATLIVIDHSANDRIRFFAFPETPLESAEEIGDWYISWLTKNHDFSADTRRFSLRFFDRNRTLRVWEHRMMLSENGCVNVDAREIPFIERVAFCR